MDEETGSQDANNQTTMAYDESSKHEKVGDSSWKSFKNKALSVAMLIVLPKHQRPPSSVSAEEGPTEDAPKHLVKKRSRHDTIPTRSSRRRKVWVENGEYHDEDSVRRFRTNNDIDTGQATTKSMKLRGIEKPSQVRSLSHDPGDQIHRSGNFGDLEKGLISRVAADVLDYGPSMETSIVEQMNLMQSSPLTLQTYNDDNFKGEQMQRMRIESADALRYTLVRKSTGEDKDIMLHKKCFSQILSQISDSNISGKMKTSSEVQPEPCARRYLSPPMTIMTQEDSLKPLMSKSISAITMETEVPSEPAKVYRELYDCMPPPIFMFLITVLELGVFIYHTRKFVHHPRYGSIGKYSPAPLDSVLIYNPTRRYEVWRYLTYAFVHSGYMHIINNVVVQLFLGILLEMVHKCWRVLAIYFAGVLAGSLATSISEPYNYLAGASAGVYALLTAHLSTVILNWTEMERPWIRIFVVLGFAIHDAGTAVYFKHIVGEETNVGYAAHLGGGVAGLLVGIHVLKNLQWEKWETVLWYMSVVICFLLLGFAILWNIIGTDMFP